jgi:hypothetical protein
MGGYGSGRPGWRPVVEDGLKLDSYKLQRDGLVSTRAGGRVLGSLVWSSTMTGEQVASISYTVDYAANSLTLHYTATVHEETQKVNDLIWLNVQRTNFGGSRFLFVCPRCTRRAAKLYLPCGAVYFRCRRCYNLTYQSSNESHRFDSLFRHIAAKTRLPFNVVRGTVKAMKWGFPTCIR